MVPIIDGGHHEVELRLELGTAGPWCGSHQLNLRFCYTGDLREILLLIGRSGPYMGREQDTC